MSKRPSFQFYPSDWRNDPGLRLCSVAARGLWMDMLCLMHEGQPYGFLTVQGRSIDAAALARLVGESPTAVKRWLKELAENEVYSVDDSGTIFSRRMVRDEDLRERRAEVGRQNGGKGAAFGHLGSEHGKKGGRPRKETGANGAGEGVSEPRLKPPQNPRPSSSSSSSSSSPSSKPPSPPSAGMPADLAAVMEAGGFVSPPGDAALLRTWIGRGARLEEDIIPIVRAEATGLRGRTGQAPRTLKIFEQAVMAKVDEDEREVRRLNRIAEEGRRDAAAASG